jgi:hypothetical protein
VRTLFGLLFALCSDMQQDLLATLMSALARFQKTRSSSKSSTTSSEGPSRLFRRSESWGSLEDSSRIQPNNIDVNPLSPQTNKHLKTYGNELCQKHQIPENTLNAFVDVSSLS